MARVNGLTLHLPPLRERREEVFHLFRSFLGAAGSAMENFKPLFVEGLCLHDWPLNVRELAQSAKRCQVISADSWPLSPRLLPMLIERRAPPGVAADSIHPLPSLGADGELVDLVGSRTAAWYRRHRPELQGLLEALERCDRNVSRAASDVGMSRQRAQRLLAVWSRLQGTQR
jgi:DNA-binding NtrC family response regulator